MSAKKSSVAGKRCLILDDEFLIALDIQQILESAGAAEAVCASNADEACAQIAAAAPPFDFAVLDVRLSGAEATSLSVASALTARGTPFIFLTGMRGDSVHAGQFPDAPVLEKPYDAAGLLAAIARALPR